MCAHFHSPRIITNGLVLALDAANSKSYSGSGTFSKDLSGVGNNGTLINGTGFSVVDGAFEFDGVNDTIRIASNPSYFFPLNNFSIETTFRSFGTIPTTGTSPGLFGFTYGIRSFVNSSNITFAVHDGVNPTISTNSNDSTNYRDGRWYCPCFVCTPTGISIYVNGQHKRTQSGTWNGTSGWSTNAFNLGRDNNNSMYYFYGQISNFKLYNRALTPQEIQQNFNAIKSRYNL